MENDLEEKKICPYNKSHHILLRRFNTHLIKCRISNPNTPLATCDFNVTHRIPKPELQWHHQTCPDRKAIEVALHREADVQTGLFPISNIDATEESWDDEVVKPYDPQAYCENREIVRHRDVVPPKERKDFRQQERFKFQQLRNENEQLRSGLSRNNQHVPGSSPRPGASKTSETAAELLRRIQLTAPK